MKRCEEPGALPPRQAPEVPLLSRGVMEIKGKKESVEVFFLDDSNSGRAQVLAAFQEAERLAAAELADGNVALLSWMPGAQL